MKRIVRVPRNSFIRPTNAKRWHKSSVSSSPEGGKYTIINKKSIAISPAYAIIISYKVCFTTKIKYPDTKMYPDWEKSNGAHERQVFGQCLFLVGVFLVDFPKKTVKGNIT
ncbi:MAG: hypothetical protein ACYC21_15895 [Eubacteriales bacterium]